MCEGSSDKAFFSEITRGLGLERDFQVQYPKLYEHDSGGKSKFGRFLGDAKTQEDFIRTVEAVLVVGDKDDDTERSFREVQGQIQQAGLSVPATVLRATTDGIQPRVVVMMLPLDSPTGNLETVLLAAAYSKWPNMQRPVDRFIADSPANNWESRKQSKARMRCVIAGTCQQNPSASLYWAWTKYGGDCSIPLDHNSLDDIRTFLEQFARA